MRDRRGQGRGPFLPRESLPRRPTCLFAVRWLIHLPPPSNSAASLERNESGRIPTDCRKRQLRMAMAGRSRTDDHYRRIWRRWRWWWRLSLEGADTSRRWRRGWRRWRESNNGPARAAQIPGLWRQWRRWRRWRRPLEREVHPGNNRFRLQVWRCARGPRRYG